MVSLCFVHMALKNSAFQQWRDLIASADSSNHPGRLSAPYMVPKRKAPAYLKLRHSTQACFVQFFTGRSALPQFLSLIIEAGSVLRPVPLWDRAWQSPPLHRGLPTHPGMA